MFEIEPDELDLSSEESVRGRKAKIRGTLTGALLGVVLGGIRAKGYADNTWSFDAGLVRFHSLNKGKKSFTFNPVSEPDNIIIAFSRDEATPDQPLKCAIYGVKLADCKRVGRVIESKTNPGRVGVHISAIGKVRLGTAYLPAGYTEVETVTERDEMMKVIDALTPAEMEPMMDAVTRANIREFVSKDQKATTSALAPVAPLAVREPGTMTEQVTAEGVLTAATAAEKTTPAAATDPATAQPAEEAPAITGPASMSPAEGVLAAASGPIAVPPVEEAAPATVAAPTAVPPVEETPVATTGPVSTPPAEEISPTATTGATASAPDEDVAPTTAQAAN